MVRDNIPDGITTQNVLTAIQDFTAGAAHDFGPSTTYDLVVDGVRYPPKAILGLAAKRATGKLLKPRDFTGGEESRCFAILRALGFTVEPKVGKGTVWTKAEYRASVYAYLGMLADEQAGRPYSKRSVREALLPKLNGRSAASSEKRMQNISAALAARGLPYIQGYKPLSNYSDDLVAVLDEALAKGQDTTPASTDADPTHDEPPVLPAVAIFNDRLVPMPANVPPPRPARRRTTPAAPGALVARERNERELGQQGELWVVAMEVHRPTTFGRPDLAAKVSHASKAEGDGLGFDVRSFDADGSPIFIEVKTTKRCASEPFIVTENEVAFSAEAGSSFRLYRVFNWGPTPRLYIITGDLSKQLHLHPREWSATPLSSPSK